MPIKKLEIDNLHPANPLNEVVLNINNNLDAITEIVNGINTGVPVMGEVGPKGDQGSEGRAGRDGIDGKDGKDGINGINGEQGPAGQDGKDGINGTNGTDGVPGINGKDGQDGLPGRDGIDGKNGADGAPGKDGATGVQGPQGPAGRDGSDGKDGAQGPQGIQGPAGKDGAVGATGPQGVAGAVGAQGIPGIAGPKGDTGPAGKDGVSITNVAITAGKLIITKSDGTTVDAGAVAATTTAPAASAPAVGGALNPTASPIATTTTTKGYIAAYCNAGVFLTLDNLKFSVTTSGSRGICCATVAGTATLSINAYYSLVGGASGSSTNWPGAVTTTTPSGSWFGWSFGNAGDGATYLVNDNTNQKVYRVTMQIGPGYAGNFISIERLL